MFSFSNVDKFNKVVKILKKNSQKFPPQKNNIETKELKKDEEQKSALKKELGAYLTQMGYDA